MVYDVAIIGAGPAGGSAAVHCAKKGLKVLVLEEHASIGEPVHCGECLSDFALENTGLIIPDEVISEKVDGVRVVFPDGYSPILYEKGMVLEKHLFEQYLVNLAEGKGAVVRLGARVEKMTKNADWTIEHSKGEDKAKLVIDASGVQSVSSRMLGLQQRFKTVVGMQYELQDIPRDGFLDFYLWPELAPHGYLWMIPKKNGRANVGLVTNQNNKAKPFLDEFIKRMKWEGKKSVKTFGGLIPASGPLQKTVSDGLILIGDAAGFTSPMFEGGTHLSLKSGEYASQIAKKAIDSHNTSVSVLGEYQYLWSKEFPNYDKLVKGKDLLYSFSDEELNQIGRTLPMNLSKMGLLGKANVGLKLLMQNKKLIDKGAIDALMTFSYSQAKYYGW
ncbi:NAD(P)/FAD-dependent oxidoreductase [Candidatus Micrarchaeota archaeon]|nr:NAD(P)/FAD-dependent oxidoreductase [Candidatus Micrarchaeota archaeon]